MNTKEINHSLRGYEKFVGVFPSDYIPYLSPGEATIINTDPHNSPGEHWVALFNNEFGVIEYFDSFGLPPLEQNIIKYINTIPYQQILYSTVQLQHETSQTCGNYCIAFVKHRLLNLPFEELLAHFTSSRIDNDNLVYRATV